jgi:hypothetical protein
MLGRPVFVVLSDKYLKSPYCVFELFEAGGTAAGKRRSS